MSEKSQWQPPTVSLLRTGAQAASGLYEGKVVESQATYPPESFLASGAV